MNDIRTGSSNSAFAHVRVCICHLAGIISLLVDYGFKIFPFNSCTLCQNSRGAAEYFRKAPCSWLRHCATSKKVTGSIPDGVIRIFH